MKKIALQILLFGVVLSTWGKSYPFTIRQTYNVQVVRVAQQGFKFYKVWGEGKTIDKAMCQAMQDAVAASLFTGVPGNEHAGLVPALCGSIKAYEEHREYFDQFFKKGEFLQYVINVNSLYPSGENNVKIRGGHRVGLYVQVKYDSLRVKLERDGIIKGLNEYF